LTENLKEQAAPAIGRGSRLAPAVLAAPARCGYASLAETWLRLLEAYRS